MTQLDGPGVLPQYGSGEYYERNAGYDLDGPFKARDMLRVLHPVLAQHGYKVRSFADVGCGGGRSTKAILDGLVDAGHPVETALGYEVSPHVLGLRHEGVEFRHEDFTESGADVDLVALFDVFEHVPDPIGFVRSVAERCDLLAMHIPLDDNVGNAVLNRYRSLMDDPGHVVFFDTASALTFVAMAGITVQNFRYTYPHRWPSSRTSAAHRLAKPLRAMLVAVNPWLAYKLVGGVSLMVLGLTPRGHRTIARR
ncbi:class I SAM-dependent methyltransferase [Dactylosporangium sucinum]|uniref:Methyltransferase n=1 Tax=Dactylosporangium sucinum TaxID=1424081 RepID=A0A917TFA9_9ACTN|nr:methyltransferase domain-containing protein [Dactylosporangium sucinum]GGM20580.1 hypothetical protein GCM10007977_022160 [Dactylosporangium sucinum]